MNEIDQITINFGESNLELLNICLMFLTFGVALDIHINDFKEIFRNPKKVIIGLTSQWILLPTFTLLLIYLVNPFPSIALGLALIAACPGGSISNYSTHLANGNTALSVTMTSFVTIMAIFTTPLIFSILSMIFPATASLLKEIALNKKDILFTVLQLVLIPLAIGIWINHQKPDWANRIRKPVKIISMVIFSVLILVALLANIKNIFQHLHLVFFLVIFHNISAYLIGFYFAKMNNLPIEDAKTISIETGIQNAGLGLVIIFSFFSELGGMLLLAAWWGIWNMISAFIVGLFGNRIT